MIEYFAVKKYSAFHCVETCQDWSKLACSLQTWAKNLPKIGNLPTKHFVIFLGNFACTMVFHTSKKFPNLADYMVKRIFHNIQLRPRNKQVVTLTVGHPVVYSLFTSLVP